MKKIAIIGLVIVSAMALSGCGKSPQQQAVSDLQELGETFKEIEKSSTGDEVEDAMKALEGFGELAQKYELEDFENTEDMDAPSAFPSYLGYSGAKIVAVSDSSYDTSMSLDVTLKTTAKFAEVRDFYKKSIADNGWKIDSQSNTSTSYSVSASKDTDYLSVDVSGDQFSSLTTVYVSYTDYTE